MPWLDQEEHLNMRRWTLLFQNLENRKDSLQGRRKKEKEKANLMAKNSLTECTALLVLNDTDPVRVVQ
jgi:AmiR/NasT family two-component response regulator